MQKLGETVELNTHFQGLQKASAGFRNSSTNQGDNTALLSKTSRLKGRIGPESEPIGPRAWEQELFKQKSNIATGKMEIGPPKRKAFAANSQRQV